MEKELPTRIDFAMDIKGVVTFCLGGRELHAS